jgi:tryptophan synthase alpha chain
LSRVAQAFESLKKKRNGALIGYVMGGDPQPKFTYGIAEALIRGGVDVLELGIPFSDPIADGPTIQAASVRALKAGTTPKIVLEIVKTVKKSYDIPVVLMTYYNPVFRAGLRSFFDQARNSGVDGIIIPDLPLEEAYDYRKAAAAFNVDTIFLVAPSTTDKRFAEIVSASSGFLYLVSHFGVTGVKSNVDLSTIALVKRALTFTSGRIPLVVGFGISTAEHVEQVVKSGADGVIVGSAFVNIVEENIEDVSSMKFELESAARKLKDATLK